MGGAEPAQPEDEDEDEDEEGPGSSTSAPNPAADLGAGEDGTDGHKHGHGAAIHHHGDLQPSTRLARSQHAPFTFFTHFLPDWAGSFFLPPSPPTLGPTHFNSVNN